MLRSHCVLFAGLVVISLGQSLLAAVQTKSVTYQDGNVTCRGYLAYDDAGTGPRPGGLVGHEWWGLDDYAKQRSRELAELGYIAFAADMYGDGKTVDHPKDAGAMAGQVRANVENWRKRAQAALAVLKSQPNCDATKLAAMGYCFGGSTALQLAYSGADLKAVATFHAALPAPTAAEGQAIQPKLLICNGADDSFIPATAIAAFRSAVESAKVDYEFVNYPGTVHSFTVPSADKHGIAGMKYNADADKDSWARLQKLLANTLK